MSTVFRVAAALACLYLPVPFIMLWLHGFHRWRGIAGRRWYALHAVIYGALVVATAALAAYWPAAAWHFPLAVRVSGTVLILFGLATIAVTYRDINSWTAMAGPQTTGSERRLITVGIYGRIRHPRYAVLILGSLGNFLMTGAPLLLAAALVTTTLTLLVIRIEERELVDHFGEAYLRYRRSVPALLPRRTRVTT